MSRSISLFARGLLTTAIALLVVTGAVSAGFNPLVGQAAELSEPATEDVTWATSQSSSSTTAAETVDAEIVDGSFQVVDDQSSYRAGDTVNATVDVRNTGNTEFTFFVGYSARDDDGETYDNNGQTGKFVTLTASETRTVTLTWSVPSHAPNGTYDLITAVWYDYPQAGEVPIDQTAWRENVARIIQPGGSSLPSSLTTAVEQHRTDAEDAVGVLPEMTYRGGTYRVAIYTTPSSHIGWTGVKEEPELTQALVDEEKWEFYDTSKVLVFRRTSSGYSVVRNADTAYNVTTMAAWAVQGFSPRLGGMSFVDQDDYNDYFTPSQNTLDDVFEILDGEVFVQQRITESWVNSEEDRYLVVVRAMASTGTTSIIPESIRSTLTDVDDKQEALSVAESAVQEVDKKRARRAIQAYIGHVEEMEALAEYGEELGAVLDYVLYFAEYEVYSDRRIRMLERTLRIADRRGDVSLDPDLRSAMQTVIAEHEDMQTKVFNRFQQFLEEQIRSGALDLAGKGTSFVAKKFGSYLATEVARSVGAKTASALTSVASGAASGILIGLTVSNFLFNMDGMYEAGLKAKYAHLAAQEFDAVADAVRSEHGDAGYVYDNVADYRSVDRSHHLAYSVFWFGNSQILNATWVDDAKDAVFDAFGIQNGASIEDERQRYIDTGQQAEREARTLFYPPTLERVVEDVPADRDFAPNRPSAPNPSDGATGASTSAKLIWNGGDPDGDQVTYDVYLSKGSGDPSTLVADDITETSYDPTLEAGTTYFWKVVATDPDGDTTVGPVWSFTTSASGNDLPTVSDPAPSDGAGGFGTGLSLSWQGNDADGDSLSYEVYFGTDRNDPAFYTETASTSVSVDGLDRGETYYWRVVPDDGTDENTNTPTWSFSTGSSGSVGLSLSNFEFRNEFDDGPLEIHGGIVPRLQNGRIEYDASGNSEFEEFDVRVVDPDRGLVIGTVVDRGFGHSGFEMVMDEGALFRQPGDHTVTVIAHHVASGETFRTTTTAHVGLDPDADQVTVLPVEPEMDDTITLDASHMETDSGGDPISHYYWHVYDVDESIHNLIKEVDGSSLDRISFDPSETDDHYFSLVNDPSGSGTQIDDGDVFIQEPGSVEPDLSVQEFSVPGTVTVGDGATARLAVENTGETEANTLVRWKVDGTVDQVEELGIDGDGDVDDETETFHLSEGTHTIGAVWIDAHNEKHTFSRTVTVQPNDAPNAPSNPSPSHTATGVSPGSTLGWSGGDPDGDSVTYEVYLEKGSSDPTTKVGSSSSSSFSPGSLEPDTTYYWRVVATDEHGRTATSDVWRFHTEDTTNDPPTARASASPPTVGLGGTATLDAGSSSDPDGDALSYDWTLVDAPGSASPTAPSGATGDVTLPVPGTYTFEVAVSDGRATDRANVTVEATLPETALDLRRPNTSDPATVDAATLGDVTVRSELVVSGDVSSSEMEAAVDRLRDGGSVAVRVGGQSATVDSATFGTPVRRGGDWVVPVTATVEPPALDTGAADLAVAVDLPSACWPAEVSACPAVVDSVSDTEFDAVVYEGEPIGTPTVAVESATTGVGNATTANVTLSGAPAGLADFQVAVSVANGSVASITGASYPGAFDPAGTSISADGSTVTLSATDPENLTTPGATGITLASVELAGVATGETPVEVTVDRLTPDRQPDGSLAHETSDGTLRVDLGDDAPPTIDIGHSRADERVGTEAPTTVRLAIADRNPANATLEVRNATTGTTLLRRSATEAFGRTVEVEWNATGPSGAPVPSGSYEVVVNATDAANNTATANLTLAVDNREPTVDATTLRNETGPTIDADRGGVLRTAGQLTVNATADGTPGDPQTVAVLLESTFTNFDRVALAEPTGNDWGSVLDLQGIPDDGRYRVHVLATDGALNARVDTAATTVRLDRTPPRLAVTLQQVNASAARIEVRANEPISNVSAILLHDRDAQTVTLSKDGDVWAATVSISDPGEYQVAVTAIDRAGNRDTDAASAVLRPSLSTQQRRVVIKNNETGTFLDIRTDEEVAGAFGTVTESDVPLANLSTNLAGARFLDAEFSRNFETNISRALVAIPVNESKLPAGVSPSEVAIRRYNGTTDAWEAVNETTVEQVDRPSIGVSGEYWVTTVSGFSTYGVVAEDDAPPSLESVTPTAGTSFPTSRDGVQVEVDYADAATGVNASAVRVFFEGTEVTAAGATEITSEYATYNATGLAPGQTYDVRVLAVDEAGNARNLTTSFELSTDTAAPALVGATPNDGATLPPGTERVPLTVEYGDAGSGVDPSSVTVLLDGTDVTDSAAVSATETSYTATGLETGTHTFTVEVADERGNTETFVVEFTVEAQSGGSGGGGGGGGGGSITPPQSVAQAVPAGDGVRVGVTNPVPVKAARTLLGDVGADGVTYEQLTVRFAAEAEDFALTLEPLAGRPASVPAPPGDASLGYYRVTGGVPDSAVETAALTFSLDEALPATASPDDVTVFRYHDGSWQRLETARRGGSYRATSPGFSVFAVAVAPQSETTVSTTTTMETTDVSTTTATTVSTTAASTPTTTTETTTADGGLPGFDLGVTLVALAALVLLLRRRS